MNAQEILKQEKPSGGGHWAGSEARSLLRFLRLLGFPGLEFLPLGAALGLFLHDLVEFLLLIGFQHATDVGLSFLLGGRHFVFHGFLISGWQFVQVLAHQLFASVPLLAHQLADLLALFRAQVQLAERATFAPHAVFTAVTWATHHVAFRAAHRAWAFWRSGHGNGWQGSSEHQSDKGLAHGDSPVSIPVSPDVSRLRRSRSAAVRG
eukprot:gene20406-24240_t